jgi:hypothetical protein
MVKSRLSLSDLPFQAMIMESPPMVERSVTCDNAMPVRYPK